MTGNFPSLAGRNTSARKTRPSSMVIGTSQSTSMPSRNSCRSLSEAMDVLPRLIFMEATEAWRALEVGLARLPKLIMPKSDKPDFGGKVGHDKIMRRVFFVA